MPIDKILQQEYMYAAKDNENWRDKKNLPINVIPFPFKKTFKEELEDLEKEREILEKEKETGIKTIKRLASHNPEALAFEYWFDRWQDHELRDQFKTLKSFISWSLANEDQPTFQKGGIAGLFKRKIKND